MSDGIRVNGNAYSWGSLVFKLDGELYRGFRSVSYSEKRERAKYWGMGRAHAPMARTSGKYTPDPVKVAGKIGSVQKLREALAARAPDGKSYGNVEFQGLLQYIEYDETEITVEFDRLVWISNSAGHEEAAEALTEEFELDTMLIRRNGLTLYDATDGEP